LLIGMSARSSWNGGPKKPKDVKDVRIGEDNPYKNGEPCEIQGSIQVDPDLECPVVLFMCTLQM
ncbi:MAG: hypothetical protein PVJ86_09275, partial [Phycisphaerales bacterium]